MTRLYPTPNQRLISKILRVFGHMVTGMLVALLIALLIGTWTAYRHISKIAQVAGQTPAQLVQTIRQGLRTNPKANQNQTVFLVLGVDTLGTRGNSTSLTDTMMLVGINHTNGAITLYSLPRDLWSPEYKTKINALYVYGQQRYPTEPQRFTKEVVQDLTQIPIDYTVVLSMETVAQMIDAIGGLQINVPEGFTDSEFPRPDVDVTKVTDPAKLYTTITFAAGPQTMTSEQVLQYIRSRHSTGDQGTDNARSNRQQEVLLALFTQLKQPKAIVMDAQKIGQLYKLYNQHLAAAFPVEDAIGLGLLLAPSMRQIQVQSFHPSISTATSSGVLQHPNPALYNNQWVFEIKDRAAFRQEIRNVFYPKL